MKTPVAPTDEAERLATLTACNVLDTPPEERFDRITRLAARLFDVPIALVSLVDGDRQWFKSCTGLGASETPREVSFCGHAILDPEVLVVEDALADERFRDNPLVVDEPRIRFYAGCPLAVDGHRLGTLCIIDTEPRQMPESDVALLRDLASMVQEQLSALCLATVDELTGLTNRRGFQAIARHALEWCRLTKHPATLAYLDLDGLKGINDNHGHAAGDLAIASFAAVLLETFRGSDVVARLGGDEFAVLVVGTGCEQTERPIERLRDALNERNEAGDLSFLLSCSIGIAPFEAARHRTVDDLIEAADRRMYAHKARRADPARGAIGGADVPHAADGVAVMAGSRRSGRPRARSGRR